MLKTVHITLALLSIGGYIGRGVLMLRDSPILSARWVRITPHIVDTLLLLAGIGLTLSIHQYPFVQSWLTAKVIALIAYILVGAIGLRYGRTKRIRATAWIGAILIFGYIVGVALSRSPTLGW
jgi:uncharacterized membrane protein SirB2